MTTRVRGTGLGLAIVKKIVEEHLGEISFFDRAGGGTHVRISFDAGRLAALESDRESKPTATVKRVARKLMALEVLVVDDEADIRELVSGVLEDEGYAVRTAADSTQTLEALEDRRPSMVLLDVWLQGSRLDGLQLLQEIKRRDPTLPVLMISGHGNLDTAVAAVREGAVDFIEKPFEAERLIYLVDRATETDRLRRENETLRQQVGPRGPASRNSVAINTVRATLKRVAPTGSRVLISGPPGVGKEIAARMIHQWSPRAKAPFIVLSAAMMSPERVEEELFGSESEGTIRPGLLEHAHGGTLFLDEIADMPLTTQAKILRVLTDQSYARVGGQRPVKVDVRVLSATSRNLQEEIAAGRFREDLFYRLNVVPVKLPPLRERREDIPELVSHFLARFAAERRMSRRRFRRKPWRPSRPTIGRAMSASFGTSSNGR